MEHLSKIDDKVSYQIWILKIIAIFLVFYAHMPVNTLISNNYPYLERIYRYLGMVGVPCFFFISGYLFKRGRILKKTRNLLCPLFIWGTISYILRFFKSEGNVFSITDLFLNIIGHNSYLYFVTVLYVMILLYNLYDNDYFWIILGIISIWLYQSHVLTYAGWFTPYMNPLDFIPYFSLGHLVRKYELWQKITNFKIIIIAIAVIIPSLLLKNIYIHIWYFNIWSIVLNIFSIGLLLSATSHLKDKHNWLIRLGKCTFVIYLCHMPVVTTINSFLTVNPSMCMEIIKVPISFLLITALVYAGNLILTKFNMHRLMEIIGYRN